MCRIWPNIFWNSEIDCVIKTIGMFSSLLQTNTSVTIDSGFLLLRISAIISSNNINNLRSFSVL